MTDITWEDAYDDAEGLAHELSSTPADGEQSKETGDANNAD